jgi:hypothetical protein
MGPWGPKHVAVNNKIQSMKYWFIVKPFLCVDRCLPNRMFVTQNRIHTVEKESGVNWCLRKLSIFVASSKTFFHFISKSFWNQHLSVNKAVCCDYVRIFFLTRAAEPLIEPNTDAAPWVQMPTQFSQDRLFCLLVSADLCNRKSFLEFHHHLQILQMIQHNIHWWNMLTHQPR